MEIITLTGGKTCRYLLSWENGEKCEERHSHSCPSGDAASSCYLGKVRHSLANGAMEKGASASAPSSTSGDEIVGKGGSRDPINSPKRTTFRLLLGAICFPLRSNLLLPFLWDKVNPHLRASSLMPDKQAKSF